MKRLFTLLIAVLLMIPVGLKADNWIETFDDQTVNNYNEASVTCAISGTWTLSAAGNFSYGNSTFGSPCVVINDDNAGAHITTPVLNTIGTVYFKYAFKSGSSTNVFKVQISTDGTTFADLDTHTLGDESDQNLVDYSLTIDNAATTVYIRILSDNQDAHLFIEDFRVTNNGEVYSDTDAPVWATDYPAVEAGDTYVNLATQLDESSTVYYVVLENDATAPTVDEVKAGTGAAAAVAVANGSFTGGSSEVIEKIEGLVIDTDYDIYVVAEDDEGTPNVQAGVTKLEVLTVELPVVLMQATFDTDLSPFTAVNVSGDQVWYQSSGYAKASGYSGGSNYANEDWLISIGIDLAAATGEVLSFETANNYGDANTTLKVKIATDFSGTYDAASVAAATWTDITDQFTLSSGGSWSFVESGEVDFTPYAESGTGYLAFVYECPDANAGTWEVDNVLYTGFLVPGADATLSDLTVDVTTIDGFDAATFSYSVELPAGTTTIPVVAATTTDDNATMVITQATDLAGEAAARTATVSVTAQDGTTTQDYTVIFNPIIEVADLGALRAMTDETRKYVVTGEVVLTHKDSYRNKKYFEDASGAIEIDDSPGVITTVYNIGDGVTGLQGEIADYNGMLQMNPTADAGTATTTGNAVVAQVLTVTEFTTNFESYEAELVSIEGVTFADAGAAFANGSNYAVTVGTDATVARTHFYDVVTGAIPKMADITGIAVYHYDEAKVGFRSQADIVAYSSDATLSDLTVDGSTVTDFAAATMSYDVLLAEGTTTIPTVDAVVTDANASYVVAAATDLAGDAAARTATVTVTAQDGTTADYTVVFSIDVNVFNNNSDNFRIYPNPANEVLNISSESIIKSFEVIDITGARIMSGMIDANGLNSINVSDLERGVYFIKLQTNDATAALRFVKQ